LLEQKPLTQQQERQSVSRYERIFGVSGRLIGVSGVPSLLKALKSRWRGFPAPGSALSTGLRSDPAPLQGPDNLRLEQSVDGAC
jgi:hypothetical protein